MTLIRCKVLSSLTSKRAMLRTSWSNKIQRDVRGPTDILMWKWTIGPGIALAHHPLANKVHSPHDKKGQDYPNDRTNSTAVWLGLIGGWLWFFWKNRRRKLNVVIKRRAVYTLLFWSSFSKSVSTQSAIHTVSLKASASHSGICKSNILIQDTRLHASSSLHKAVWAKHSPFCLAIYLVRITYLDRTSLECFLFFPALQSQWILTNIRSLIREHFSLKSHVC